MKLVMLITLMIFSIQCFALDKCGVYELEGILRLKNNKHFLIYHEKATSEIRFEITKSLSPLSRIKDGTPIKSNFRLLSGCDYDCKIELIAALTLDPRRRDKRILERLMPIKSLPCEEIIQKK